MKLKNNALQELYDTLVSGNPTFSPYAESPFDKAFRECDEKIQKDIDIWKCGNEILLSANTDLANYKQKFEKEVEKLKGLHDRNNVLEKSNGTLLGANMNLCSENRDLKNRIEQLKKDLVDAKIQIKYFKESRDDWQNRVEHAEDEVEALKKDNEDLEKRLMETTEILEKVNSDRNELQKDRDSYHDLYTELSKTYDKLFEESNKMNARTDCLRFEVEWYRKHYKEKSDKIENLKKKLEYLASQNQKLTSENKRLQNNVRAGYDQGQTDLWVKLQNVRDVKPEEFDPECETLGDILDMDLEDFLDAYKKWQEEKEKERLDHMRDYLNRFCRGRLCTGCPLESDKYKCGNGYSFRKFTDNDCRIIPDEELERYYEKARGCGQRSFAKADDPCSGVRKKKIEEACDAFCDGLKAGLASEVKAVPVSFDIPIKDTASWECTLETTVEVNKDLLEKVCGIKPEEEKHKLEYGDAVRLPWRDYDYMYIGPDNEEETVVRMFDPKNHAISTTHIGNVRYSGCKIIICDEDDLKKIWNHKK